MKKRKSAKLNIDLETFDDSIFSNIDGFVKFLTENDYNFIVDDNLILDKFEIHIELARTGAGELMCVEFDRYGDFISMKPIIGEITKRYTSMIASTFMAGQYGRIEYHYGGRRIELYQKESSNETKETK